MISKYPDRYFPPLAITDTQQIIATIPIDDWRITKFTSKFPDYEATDTILVPWVSFCGDAKRGLVNLNREQKSVFSGKFKPLGFLKFAADTAALQSNNLFWAAIKEKRKEQKTIDAVQSAFAQLLSPESQKAIYIEKVEVDEVLRMQVASLVTNILVLAKHHIASDTFIKKELKKKYRV